MKIFKWKDFVYLTLFLIYTLFSSFGCVDSLFYETQTHDDCLEQSITGNGSIEIPLHKGCNNYAYIMQAQENSSIFEVSVNVTLTNESLSTPVARTIVNFEEKSKTLTSWELFSNLPFQNNTISRTSNLRIKFTVSGGNWTGTEVKLIYKEITFETYFRNNSGVENGGIKPWVNTEGRSYRPNCVSIFQITKPKNLTDSNIMITLHYLDIDVVEEEYLLIGAGLQPYEGPPPLFLSYSNEVKQYFINDENAYVAFVSRAARENHKGFYITWKYTGKKIENEEEIGKEDIEESASICIYNITAALEEFNRSQNWFEDFRGNLAAIASKYAKETLLNEENGNISSSSISIFRVPGVVTVNESSKALYAMVKISKNIGRAAFKWNDLERIIDIYAEEYTQNGTDIFQFGKCPARRAPESWSSLAFYLIIPIICCLFLLIWTWKQNPVLMHFAKKKRRKKASQIAQSDTKYYQEEGPVINSLSQNSYASLPKLQVTCDRGRRYTLNFSDALLSDGEQSEDEIFNRIFSQNQSSTNFDSERIRPTNMMPKTKRPEINHAFELEEDVSYIPKSQEQREEHLEHMYDSVKSMSQSRDSKDEETKL